MARAPALARALDRRACGARGDGLATLPRPRAPLRRFFGRAPAGEEGVVGVVVRPFAVAAGEDDVSLAEPAPDAFDVRGSRMVIHDVRVRQIELVRHPYGIFRTYQPDAPAVVDAPLDQRIAVDGKRLRRRVGDLAGESEAARRIAVGARVPLHEDAMEDGVLRIVDPVLLRDPLAPDAEVDAADGDVAERRGRGAHVRRRLV